MGKKAFILIIGAVVVVCIYYFFNRSEALVWQPPDIETTNKVDDKQILLQDNSDTLSIKQTTKYQIYTSENFSTGSDGRRVLFFYANWCPTCQPADQSFRENQSSLPDDTTVIRVNYNDNETDQAEKDLARKYGVTYQHTFVQIDEEGNEVTKWNGGNIDELLSKIQ